jgi:hypothetical protein
VSPASTFLLQFDGIATRRLLACPVDFIPSENFFVPSIMKAMPIIRSGAWTSLVLILAVCPATLRAGDQPQWGQRHTRNMISDETGLPVQFDPDTGEGIEWSVDLGYEAYGSPIVSQGRVFIGTNNAAPRDPRHEGTHGVLMCLSERDGSLLWQLVVPRLLGDDGFSISLGSPSARHRRLKVIGCMWSRIVPRLFVSIYQGCRTATTEPTKMKGAIWCRKENLRKP